MLRVVAAPILYLRLFPEALTECAHSVALHIPSEGQKTQMTLALEVGLERL